MRKYLAGIDHGGVKVKEKLTLAHGTVDEKAKQHLKTVFVVCLAGHQCVGNVEAYIRNQHVSRDRRPWLNNGMIDAVVSPPSWEVANPFPSRFAL